MNDYVLEDVCKYYSILYEIIKSSEDETTALQLANTLLNSPSRSKEMDSYDCMFFFMLKVFDILQLDPKVCRYVTFCKDIFYYRLKKKDRAQRINLIYYSIYVLVTKKVSYKPINVANTHDYLFKPVEIDYRKVHEVQTLKAECQKETPCKKVSVPHTICDFRDPNIEVVRK
jgi:hypothetical protein